MMSGKSVIFTFGVISIVYCVGTVHGSLNLALIHTNDIHSRISQTNKYSAKCSDEDAAENKCYGGAARMWTKIQELRKAHTYSLLLDAGDQFQGTLWSTHYQGLEAAKFMNWLEYDIMTFGNHDFDYGTEILSRFALNITFPVVCANLKTENNLDGTYVPSHVFEFEGFKVGVIGYLTAEMKELVDPIRILGTTVEEEIKSVRKEAEKLKAEGVKIIIALGHSGYDLDKKLAAEIEQVDVVIGGHSHSFLYTGEPPSNEDPLGDYPTLIKQAGGDQALVLQEYAYSKYLGYLNITFSDDGKIIDWNGQPILLDGSIEQDAALLAEEMKWRQPLEDVMKEDIGNTFVFLHGATGSIRKCRVEECNIGNMVTEAVLRSYIDGREPKVENGNGRWSEVAVVAWNGGGIRGDHAIGRITLGEVIEILPFRNTVELLEVTGKILLEMLENSVSNQDSGRFLQFSGLRVTYNFDKNVGRRVVAAKIRCADCSIPRYHPIDENKRYKILTNSFMANGGDGYDMLTEETVSRVNIGTLESDAVTYYIRNYSPLLNGLDERIKFVKDEKKTGKPLTCGGNASMHQILFNAYAFVSLYLLARYYNCIL